MKVWSVPSSGTQEDGRLVFLTGLFLNFFSAFPPVLYQYHRPLEDVSEKVVSVGMVAWGCAERELSYEIQIT